jgi:pantothenate kinase
MISLYRIVNSLKKSSQNLQEKQIDRTIQSGKTKFRSNSSRKNKEIKQLKDQLSQTRPEKSNEIEKLNHEK